MAGRERASERLCQRAPGARRWKGRHVRDPRAQHPRLGARRFRTGADRRRGRPRLRLQLRVRRRVPALHSEAVGILCEDAEQLAKVEAVSGELNALEHVLTYHDLDGLATHGRDFAAANPSALDDASAAIAESDLFTIIYTSGTTGQPKGCMLSHRNYYAMASVVDQMDSYYREDDLMPLPPARAQLRAADAPDGCVRRVPDRSPSRPASRRRGAAAGAPDDSPQRPARVREGAHGGTARFDEATGLKRRLIDWALPIGRQVSRLEADGEPVPAGLRARHRMADRLVFSKVRARLGGRLRIAISGSAAREGDRGVLRRDRRAHRGGLRPHRVHDGVQHEPP